MEKQYNADFPAQLIRFNAYFLSATHVDDDEVSDEDCDDNIRPCFDGVPLLLSGVIGYASNT